MANSEHDRTEEQVIEEARRLWLAVLPDGVSGSFTSCGGDSLTGLRLLGAVYQCLDVRLTFEVLTEAQDVDDFARRVAAAAFS